MDYRQWINKKLNHREKVAIALKKHFFKDDPWPKISLKCATWLSKLIHEGHKCWPEYDEWGVCDWLAEQSKHDLLEMIQVPDTRRNLSPIGKDLLKHIEKMDGGAKDGTMEADASVLGGIQGPVRR